MTNEQTTTLNVFLHNEPVGTLTLLSNEQIIFSFNEAYSSNPLRPTLSLSFKERISGNLLTRVRSSRTRLSPFFSNLLPEGPLREYLAKKAGVNPAREFFLLKELGADLPGAITVKPADRDFFVNDVPITNSDETLCADAYHFSLAGIQLKFSAIMDASGGLTIPAKGVGGSWIIKLPSFRFEGVPENEFSMMSLASQIGLDVPEVRLVPIKQLIGLPKEIGQFTDKSALAVRRFDRTEKGSVHCEDFAQIFGLYPENKYGKGSYKNIAEVIWAEGGSQGAKEFIGRLVFNTLIGNADMHMKNWSVIYPNKMHAQIAPGYDFVSTIPYIDDTKMALNYLKTRAMIDLSMELLEKLALKAKIPKNLVVESVKNIVQRFTEIWQKEKRHLPITDVVSEKIDNHQKSICILKEL